jgi:hypothetical protein
MKQKINTSEDIQSWQIEIDLQISTQVWTSILAMLMIITMNKILILIIIKNKI